MRVSAHSGPEVGTGYWLPRLKARLVVVQDTDVWVVTGRGGGGGATGLLERELEADRRASVWTSALAATLTAAARSSACASCEPAIFLLGETDLHS